MLFPNVFQKRWDTPSFNLSNLILVIWLIRKSWTPLVDRHLAFKSQNFLTGHAYLDILEFAILFHGEVAIEPCNKLKAFFAILNFAVLDIPFWRVNSKSHDDNSTKNGSSICKMQISHRVLTDILNVGAKEGNYWEVKHEIESCGEVWLITLHWVFQKNQAGHSFNFAEPCGKETKASQDVWRVEILELKTQNVKRDDAVFEEFQMPNLFLKRSSSKFH